MKIKNHITETHQSGTFEAVYEIVRQIPRGKVATYGMVAALIGNVKLSRAVGYALHANPDNASIPCHRVVFRDGSLSESYAFGGTEVQRQKLLSEGVRFGEDGKVIMSECLWDLRESGNER